MTNRDLAELRDPEHRQAGWWVKHIPYSCPHCGRPLHGTFVTPPAEDLIGGYRCLSCRVMHTSEFSYTGPDWHASDDACFRDWRPVLLAAGCEIVMCGNGTWVDHPKPGFLNNISGGKDTTYRAAILAALAWLAEHKPELLREAIARVAAEKKYQRLFEPWDEVNGWCEHNHQFSYRLDDEDNSDGCMQCALTAAIARAEKAEAERDRLAQYHGGHRPDCGGMDELEGRCDCGYLQGEAYRELITDLAAARAELGALGVRSER